MGADILWVGDWRVDPSTRLVTRGGERVRLEPKMLDVLMMLVERRGEAVSREELERRVWSGAAVGTDLLNRTVWKLRRAFDDDSATPRYIETIPRVGYRLVASVRTNDVPVEAAAPRRLTALMMGVGALATAVVVGWFVLGRVSATPSGWVPDRIVPLTSTPGYEAAPSLSQDGRRVAYQRYDKSLSNPTWDVAVMDIETRETRLLAADPDVDEYGPVWSPGGDSVAFLRVGSSCEILVQSLTGKPVHVVSCAPDQGHEIAWQPDGSFVVASSRGGQTLGLVRIRRDTGEEEQLTTPPVGYDGDRRPRPSSDGARIAFVRQRTDGVSDLYVLDVRDPTHPARLTFDNRRIGGLAWDGGETALIFSSTRGGDSGLWRVPLGGGDPRPVPMSGRNASRISVRNHSLVYEEYFGDSDIFVFDPATSVVEPWGGSSRSEWGITLSPDGHSVAFLSDRTGATEIWIIPATGGQPRRLTQLDGAEVDPPQWSPDGRMLTFAASLDGQFDVFTLAPTGGSPRRVTGGLEDERAPAWWNGQLVFSANRTGASELWSVDSTGGAATRLTSGGGWAARPSPDGRHLFYTRPNEPGLWRLNGDGASELVWHDVHPGDWANWVATDTGFVYHRVYTGSFPLLEVVDLRRGTSDTLVTLDSEATAQAGVAVLPDGRVLFSRIVRSESDLWMAR